MKKLVWFIALSLIIASCAQDRAKLTAINEVPESPISTIINQTHIPIAITPSPSNIIHSPTNTIEPELSLKDATATAVLSQMLTEIPPSKLRRFELTIEDFSPREVDYKYVGPIGGEVFYVPNSIDLIGFTFLREKDSVGCMFELIQMKNATDADALNSEIKSKFIVEGIEEELLVPSGFSIPTNTWISYQEDQSVLRVGFSSGEVVSFISYPMEKGKSVEDEIIFVASLAQAQYNKLLEGGKK